MTITRKGCARGMAQITLALIIFIFLLVGFAYGGDKIISIVVHGQLDRQAAIREHERQERIKEAKTETEIAKEESLRWLEIASSGSWLILQGGIALVALAASSAIIPGFWRFALGWTLTSKAGWSVLQTRAGRQPVPQSVSISYAPRNQLTQKDISLPLRGSENAKTHPIELAFAEYNVPVRVVSEERGPVLTVYGLKPGRTQKGEKITNNKITNLIDEIAMELGVEKVRFANLTGAIGLEVPNAEREHVHFADLVNTQHFKSQRLPLALGVDIAGSPIITSLDIIPHLLISGATGSGKSVCINALIASLLSKHSPDELRFIMIDPKMVELIGYNGIPHLITSVITEPEEACASLAGMINEMEQRYTLLSRFNKRDVRSFNQAYPDQAMPTIVIIIDEVADLMMAFSKKQEREEKIEKPIVRLAQKARATDMHVILATQRPSVNVITGLIKANIGTRIALAVTSQIDSRVILDEIGAESLLGDGDMLFSQQGKEPRRLQGAFISDKEIKALVTQWKQADYPVEPLKLNMPQLPQPRHWRDALKEYIQTLKKGEKILVRNTRDWVRGQGVQIPEDEMQKFTQTVLSVRERIAHKTHPSATSRTDGQTDEKTT